MQLAGDGDLLNAADLVVRVAETNLDLVLGDMVDGADIYVSSGAEKILKRKLLTQSKLPLPDGFARILEISGVPDVRVAVESAALEVLDVWKLRQGARARKFREWLRQAEADNVDELGRMYVASLENATWAQRVPMRVLRFAITAAIGVFDTPTGVVVGAIDNFFVERYVSGYRPRLMLDDLRKLLLH